MKGRKPSTADVIDLMKRARASAPSDAGAAGAAQGQSQGHMPAPDGLDEGQRAVWAYIVEHAPEGTFSPEDVILLERLVRQIWIAEQAEAQVDLVGLTITDRFGETKRNPSLVTLHHAITHIARLSAELGVGSVIARAKALARQQQDEGDDD